jgi:hypothetical protein
MTGGDLIRVATMANGILVCVRLAAVTDWMSDATRRRVYSMQECAAAGYWMSDATLPCTLGNARNTICTAEALCTVWALNIYGNEEYTVKK